MSHPDLAGANIRDISGGMAGACTEAGSAACLHGTFVAGMLSARRSAMAPAICPACTLLLRPIFAEMTSGNGQMPSATPVELAAVPRRTTVVPPLLDALVMYQRLRQEYAA